MEKVIESLQKKEHALLESPTGTGKTLCLLCATLAWRQHEKEKLMVRFSSEEDLSQRLPIIVYASRTHSQLSQVIKELKATQYKPRTTILGSRNQMCVHPRVKNLRGNAQNMMCKNLVSDHTCSFYNNVNELKSGLKTYLPPVVDIEDLTNAKGGCACPFYLAKELQTIADVVFMPYNYVIDPFIRQTLTMDLSKAIVIF
eukprot:TRINITY_DN8993_c0_g1_i1.p1 TRINITY_DN8993_c0_g1~~TRINITY_DN8993_c0_g1_i1.p1  ORF type:complete len:234 (-),score=34.61 TRINITY_DN8993_c0_g1_i1:245-844(-)